MSNEDSLKRSIQAEQIYTMKLDELGHVVDQNIHENRCFSL